MSFIKVALEMVSVHSSKTLTRTYLLIDKWIRDKIFRMCMIYPTDSKKFNKKKVQVRILESH